MDANTFDRVTGNLASSADRRSVLRQVAALAAVAAATAGAVGLAGSVSAKPKPNRHGNDNFNECVNRCREHGGGNRCHKKCRRNV